MKTIETILNRASGKIDHSDRRATVSLTVEELQAMQDEHAALVAVAYEAGRSDRRQPHNLPGALANLAAVRGK